MQPGELLAGDEADAWAALLERRLSNAVTGDVSTQPRRIAAVKTDPRTARSRHTVESTTPVRFRVAMKVPSTLRSISSRWKCPSSRMHDRL